MQLIRTDKVHFPRQNSVIARVRHVVGKGRNKARIRISVVITPRSRGVESGHQTGSCGHTDRAGGIGIFKPDTPFGQRGHILGARSNMATGLQHERRHLIRYDQQYIRLAFKARVAFHAPHPGSGSPACQPAAFKAAIRSIVGLRLSCNNNTSRSPGTGPAQCLLHRAQTPCPPASHRAPPAGPVHRQ